MTSQVDAGPEVNEIKFLIKHCDHPEMGEFKVFIDNDLDIDWWVNDVAQKNFDKPTNRSLIRKVLNHIANLEPVAHNWPDDLKLATKRHLGEALVSAFEEDAEGAREAMDDSRSFVAAKSKQVSRYWTLQAFLVGGLAAILLSLADLYLAAWVSRVFGSTVHVLSLCFFAGCIGAVLFSVLRFRQSRRIDSTSEKRLHYLEATARVTAGGIAGVLVGSVVKLGLFLPVFAKSGMETLAMCSVAMIAGASERLAAGIVTSTEKSITKGEETDDETSSH